jgi:hypothetical protein
MAIYFVPEYHTVLDMEIRRKLAEGASTPAELANAICIVGVNGCFATGDPQDPPRILMREATLSIDGKVVAALAENEHGADDTSLTPSSVKERLDSLAERRVVEKNVNGTYALAPPREKKSLLAQYIVQPLRALPQAIRDYLNR